jgi:hypothetical protein
VWFAKIDVYECNELIKERQINNSQEKVKLRWSITEILRGLLKSEDNGKVVLPIEVMLLFDCVLVEIKKSVWCYLSNSIRLYLKGDSFDQHR